MKLARFGAAIATLALAAACTSGVHQPSAPATTLRPSAPATMGSSASPAAPSAPGTGVETPGTAAPSVPPTAAKRNTTAFVPVPSAHRSSAAASPSTCRQVSARLLPGGAAQGAEIAGLQFINAGTKACRLGGFPTVQLLRAGRPVGPASKPTGTARTVALAPGGIAQSLLRDASTCNAPLSDHARITVPGESTSILRPTVLRACALTVGPLGPPS